MKALVLGTDKLGAAPRILREHFGVTSLVHCSGRKRKIPKKYLSDTKLIIVYTRFINHSHMWHIKKIAKARSIPIKFVDRGLSELLQ